MLPQGAGSAQDQNETQFRAGLNQTGTKLSFILLLGGISPRSLSFYLCVGSGHLETKCNAVPSCLARSGLGVLPPSHSSHLPGSGWFRSLAPFIRSLTPWHHWLVSIPGGLSLFLCFRSPGIFFVRSFYFHRPAPGNIFSTLKLALSLSLSLTSTTCRHPSQSVFGPGLATPDTNHPRRSCRSHTGKQL